jgi:hypothetical protein
MHKIKLGQNIHTRKKYRKAKADILPYLANAGIDMQIITWGPKVKAMVILLHSCSCMMYDA